LTALESEFRPVDLDELDGRLDDLARPLFGIHRQPVDEGVIALGRAAWEALPADSGEPSAWLLSAALERGRAAGPVRAAVATELARRAGLAAHPALMKGCWAVHTRTEDAEAAADVGAGPREEDGELPRGCLCAHQLAFVVLTGLVEAWESAGNEARAQHARVLRLGLVRGAA
jgi:hypothetical protein